MTIGVFKRFSIVSVFAAIFLAASPVHAQVDEGVENFVQSVGIASLSTDILIGFLEMFNAKLFDDLDYLHDFSELGAPRTALEARIAELGDVLGNLTSKMGIRND